MKDIDLDILSRVKAPQPNEKVRENAVNSAMDAFDHVQEQKNQSTTQGSRADNRQTSILTNVWRTTMNSIVKPIWNMKPATMAAATGVLMLPIAGVVAWNVLEPSSEGFAPLDDAKHQVVESKAKLEGRSQGNDLTQVQQKPAPAIEVLVAEADQSSELASPAPQPKKVVRSRKQFKRAVPTAGGLLQSELLAASPAKSRAIVAHDREVSGEQYEKFADNAVKSVKVDPVSTFSIDVDTASYARVRSMLNSGNLPPKDMVRIEELINYFDYDYAVPSDKSLPFQPNITIMQTPWNEHTKLMQIGIKGYDVDRTDQPKANLVFLLDVSGSMNAPDKLPLLTKSFRLLLQKLNPTDTVSIVTYAGRAATVLEPTAVSKRDDIISALENLQAGGSTGGAQGIEQAYRLAERNFVKDGINRVMLATDGDFNVGISNPDQLKDFIAQKRKSGIFLSVFGFGRGNYNDALMQALAQNGNGQAAYIDTLAEAQKTLVEEAGSTLFPIASDVKIQMEFNPAKIAEYRLIGYETRALKREDFNNDKIDAGEIGAGHTVTAIYELTPVGSPAILNDDLRYSKEDKTAAAAKSNELGFLKMRYKLPGESKSKLITTPIVENTSAVGNDTDFATAVAAFGQKLRSNSALSDFSYEAIADMAQKYKGEDKFGYRAAFVQLVRMAGSLSK